MWKQSQEAMEKRAPGSECRLDQNFEGQRGVQRPSAHKPAGSEAPGSGSGSGSGPDPDCLSLKSDLSMDKPINFRGQLHLQDADVLSCGPGVSSALNSIFSLLEENIITLVRKELEKIQQLLSSAEVSYSGNQTSNQDCDEEQTNRESILRMTLHFMRKMKLEDLADCLQSRTLATDFQHKHKSRLRKKFQDVFEGIAKAGSPAPLREIYTELLVTDGEAGAPNEEHEVRWMETASRRAGRLETTIRCEDLFQVPPGKAELDRTVLTKGVAGIGKTILTQKFILDWSEDKSHQNVQLLLPFTFRELNVLRHRKFSLVELLHHFFIEVKQARFCQLEDILVVFILDGLDECRLPLDFHNNQILTDIGEAASLDVLLTNLILGNLLPSARLWITSRPAAANQIPAKCVSVVTEVRGFSDPQKDKYFQKKFRESRQASRIISHIRRCRSLHIMCHIPVFCWITAMVLEDILKTTDARDLPKTLTEMYAHFLVVQTKVKKVKYDGGAETDPHWSPDTRKMMGSLGKLAFEQLQKGNLIFYEPDLMECGIQVKTASVYSGVLTQVFIEERGLYQEKVFCFIHLSVQEFLAALHVHLTFTESGINLLEDTHAPATSPERKNLAENHLHRSAVDKALQSPNGHLDLFLRFLLGLSLQTNQNILRGLLPQTGSGSQTNKDTVQYIKHQISETSSAEKNINLFHCLNELNDSSLLEEIQKSLNSGRLSTDKLSPAQWSALVFLLLSSEKDLDEFDLRKFSGSEETLLRLLPVLRASTRAVLSCCSLTPRSCEVLSLVLSSQTCSLRELDLSNNNLQDSGVKLLADAFRSPHFSLEALSLSGCLITEEGCCSLAEALNSNSTRLMELDLSYNHPGEAGLKLLSAGQQDWNLQTLRMDHGGKQRLQSGLKKYSCNLQVDITSMNRKIWLSGDGRTLTVHPEERPYPDHPHRFDYWQLLCTNGLTGRSFWEVEWKGEVRIAASYQGIKRRGNRTECRFGWNEHSWSLSCSEGGYSVWYDNSGTSISAASSSLSPSDYHRVAVYVDSPAGVLSFYRVIQDQLIHLHTFNTSFTEPLYPGFGFWTHGSSVRLCSPLEEV